MQNKGSGWDRQNRQTEGRSKSAKWPSSIYSHGSAVGLCCVASHVRHRKGVTRYMGGGAENVCEHINIVCIGNTAM